MEDIDLEAFKSAKEATRARERLAGSGHPLENRPADVPATPTTKPIPWPALRERIEAIKDKKDRINTIVSALEQP